MVPAGYRHVQAADHCKSDSTRTREALSGVDRARNLRNRFRPVTGVTLAIVALIGLGLQATSGFAAVELALVYVILVVIATGLLPRLLRQLRQEHDLFLIVSVASALTLAGVGARFFGIPLALAAFVSGLAIGESR